MNNPTMSCSQAHDKVLSLIAAAVPSKFRKVTITKETNLQKDLGFNSLGLLALVFRFEEAFGIDIERLDLKIDVGKLGTVDDLIRISTQALERAHMAPNS